MIETSESHGVPVMIHQQTLETSTTAIELGARFVMHSTDAGLMQAAMRRDFAELRAVSGSDSADENLDDTLETV